MSESDSILSKNERDQAIILKVFGPDHKNKRGSLIQRIARLDRNEATAKLLATNLVNEETLPYFQKEYDEHKANDHAYSYAHNLCEFMYDSLKKGGYTNAVTVGELLVGYVGYCELLTLLVNTLDPDGGEAIPFLEYWPYVEIARCEDWPYDEIAPKNKETKFRSRYFPSNDSIDNTTQ